MAGSTIEPMHELRIWIRESDYRALKTKAEGEGASQSKIVRQAVSNYLGEDAAGKSAPWLASLLDAVLSKYFAGFPEVLDRLVVATYAHHSWSTSQFAKLLELSGVKDPQAQDQRVSAIAEKIREYARRQADEFFQSLSAPEELIEPDEPSE